MSGAKSWHSRPNSDTHSRTTPTKPISIPPPVAGARLKPLPQTPKMQKVVQRTKIAARRAKARHNKQLEHIENGKAWSRSQQAQRLNRYNASLITSARARQREDYALGSLAPRRDVGDESEKYGSVPIYNFQPPEKHPKNTVKWSGLAQGDRVVVVKGREKGKVGQVRSVTENRGTVEVDGVNLADVSVPEWIQQEDAQQPIMTVPVGIPLEDVRLVYPLPDPVTGALRDVVVERLECMRRKRDSVTMELDRGWRVVAGTRTIIPWPAELEPEFEDYECDTLAPSVDNETFVPTLQEAPFPLSVIDELRNKYSKFRTRHDYEFVQKREAEDARGEKRQELVKKMRTPLQEAADLRAKEKAARETNLTDEQMTKIGEVIAGERAKLTGALRQMER